MLRNNVVLIPPEHLGSGSQFSVMKYLLSETILQVEFSSLILGANNGIQIKLDIQYYIYMAPWKQDPVSSPGQVPQRKFCTCWGTVSLLTQWAPRAGRGPCAEDTHHWGSWQLEVVWLPLSTPLLGVPCIVPASLCHSVLSRVWHVVTWVVGPQHHAVHSGKNIWESGFSSLMEEDGLCLLPRLFQCGILLIWKCSLSGEGVRWMDKNVKFQSLEHRSGTGTWPGILQALRFGWKNKWLINAIKVREMLAYLFVLFSLECNWCTMLCHFLLYKTVNQL